MICGSICLEMRTIRFIAMGWRKRPGPTFGGDFPRHFFISGCEEMKELSVFIDESGDFGEYKRHSPYYIVTLVFHDQSIDISDNIKNLNGLLSFFDVKNYTIHTMPLIRNDLECRNMEFSDRRRIFNWIFGFARLAPIKYKTIAVDKKHIANPLELTAKLSKQLSQFLFARIDEFNEYDKIIVYYDNGQTELTRILVTAFNMVFNDVEFRHVSPVDYKLFQSADLICALELLALKAETKTLSKSELSFFNSSKELMKRYIQPIRKKIL